MRLIDADALKEHTEIVSYKNEWYETEIDEFVSVENIDSAPSIDIVRCKECMWYDADTDWANIPYCDKHHIEAYEDGFCSYGERKSDE